MSESESNKEAPKKLVPSEELSVHVSFKAESKDAVYVFLEDYEENALIKGSRFFILTFPTVADRDSGRAQIEEKIGKEVNKVANYKKSLRQIRMEEAKRKVYVADFGEDITKEVLEEEFKRFGPIEEVFVKASSGKDNKPFAFVKFETEEPAAKAVEEGVSIGETKLLVEKVITRPFYSYRRRSGERGERQGAQRSVMFTNFGSDLSKKALKDEITAVGDISYFKFEKDHAIATYRDVDTARKAIEKINGKKMNGKSLLVINAPSAAGVQARGRARGRGGRFRRGGRYRRRGSFRKRDKAGDKKRESPDKEEKAQKPEKAEA